MLLFPTLVDGEVSGVHRSFNPAEASPETEGVTDGQQTGKTQTLKTAYIRKEGIEGMWGREKAATWYLHPQSY